MTSRTNGDYLLVVRKAAWRWRPYVRRGGIDGRRYGVWWLGVWIGIY